ncbi:MAG: iron ABC transporter permease [Acidobacteriia bacterium]|nr:iron ABC transporter permease [Terriglobia bacterium]
MFDGWVGSVAFNLVLLTVLFTLLLVSLKIGRYPVSVGQIVHILASTPFLNAKRDGTNTVWIVLELIRLPRVLVVCLCGAALGMSGAAMQGTFRNPLVGPEITGVTAAASFGGALGILLGFSPLGTVASAFAWGMVGTAGTLLVSSLAPRSGTLGFILVGVILGALFSALVGLVESLADPATSLPNIVYWLLGGFGSADYRSVAIVAGAVSVAGPLLLLLSWRINLLSLSQTDAQSLGANVTALRWGVVALVTLLVAAQVSVSGGVGWVGFVIPHFARMIVGPEHSRLLPTSAGLGAVYLLTMDDLARTLSRQDIPISLLTASIGAPLFIVFFWRLQIRGWSRD